MALSKAFRALPFWDRVAAQTIPGPNGCLLFTGNKDECGYGRISNGVRLVRVHRAVAEKHHGALTPKQVVMHICDTPACINVEHLRVATQPDNIYDMDVKGRRITLVGSQRPMAKLIEGDILDIWRRHHAGESTAFISRLYRVSEAAIRNVLKGRTWTHVA